MYLGHFRNEIATKIQNRINLKLGNVSHVRNLDKSVLQKTGRKFPSSSSVENAG